MNTSVSQDHSTKWYAQAPKVELHLHLEGAMPRRALSELIRKYDCYSSAAKIQKLSEVGHYTDFSAFYQFWSWKTQLLREYEDFQFSAREAAEHLSAQNIRYVEAFFCPADFHRWGLKTPLLIEAIHRGLSQVPQIEIRLIIDLARNQEPQQAILTIRELDGLRQLGVIGVGLGGPEPGIPLEPFSEVFQMAHEHGFHTTAHAGETGGALSIWAALRELNVERLGHGTRAIQDEALIDYLAEKQIPLEVCPLSNVRSGVVGTLKDHPVRLLFERGIPISINTDNPVLLGNSMAEEFYALQNELDFTDEEIFRLMLQAINTSWTTQQRKADLIRDLTMYVQDFSKQNHDYSETI